MVLQGETGSLQERGGWSAAEDSGCRFLFQRTTLSLGESESCGGLGVRLILVPLDVFFLSSLLLQLRVRFWAQDQKWEIN